MATSAQTKFNIFTKDLTEAKHDFATHVFKIALTNTAPVAATGAVLADITQIAATGSYVAGGLATTVTKSRASGVETITGTAVTFTASGGNIGPFRYAVLYNDTQTAPAKPLIAFMDYGAALTLATGDSLAVRFNSTTPGTIATVT